MKHNKHKITGSGTKKLKAVYSVFDKEIHSLVNQPLIGFIGRLNYANKLSSNASFLHHVRNITNSSQLFNEKQKKMRKMSKRSKFSQKQKISALSLFLKRPKCYRLLYKYFDLPSPKELKIILSKIKMKSGINEVYLETLKYSLQELYKGSASNKICSLSFQEMPLTPKIFYNQNEDKFEGFCTVDESKFADAVVVFMINFINFSHKQPIAYFFTSGLDRTELKYFIKIVIKKCQEIGLIILNTVCDQSAVNINAITDLVNETKQMFIKREMKWTHDLFWINGRNIVPLYDMTHILKELRNNLLTGDMSYTVSNKEKIVKWEYYQKMYEVDSTSERSGGLSKLKEKHVYHDKINKTDVITAIQTFSRSVAVASAFLPTVSKIPIECKNICEITLLLARLLDTLNVYSHDIPDNNVYKGPITWNTPHRKLWSNSKSILKTVKFREIKYVGKESVVSESTPLCVTNLIKTIEGIEVIWKLHRRYGFYIFFSRLLNLEPVEKFLECLKSYGTEKVAPNTLEFENAFKLLLLNNYYSPYHHQRNDERLMNDCFQSLDFFLTEPMKEDVKNVHIKFNIDIFSETTSLHNYICSWILTKCLKIVESCQQCKQNLFGKDYKNVKTTHKNDYKNKKLLCSPSKELELCFIELQKITWSTLKGNIPKKDVKKNILAFADSSIVYPLKCEQHKEKLKDYFCNAVVHLLIRIWCRSVNRILCGKTNYEGDDKTKISAQIYYNMHKK